MARIGFYQTELRDRIGIKVLSAVLKSKGHNCSVFCGLDTSRLVKEILDYHPDLFALSTCTTEHQYALKVSEGIRQRNGNIFIVMGGPHPTFYPEIIYDHDCLDAVCIGEGDNAIVELIDFVVSQSKNKIIKNIWFKDENGIFKNEIRPLIEDLDSLPFPDYEIYYRKYPQLKNNPTKSFMTGRGCPHKCSYCFNHYMMSLYKDKGQYVRRHSIKYVIDHIKRVRDKYGFKWVQFNDDTFNVNKKWLYEFLEVYKKEIDFPFLCNLRADFIDEDLVKRLKKAGVVRINLGVEHGDYSLRKNVLHRNITDEQLIKAGLLLKKYKIRLFTANLIGLPGETIKDAFKTVDINRKMKVELAVSYLLQPFPKTEIYKYSINKGFLNGRIDLDELFSPCSNFVSSAIKLGSVYKGRDINKLVNLQNFFILLVKFYFLKPIILFLIRFSPNKFFQIFWHLPILINRIRYQRGMKVKISEIASIFRPLFRKQIPK